MKSNIELIYWDTVIYIAWLMDEQRPNHEMDGVYESARKISQGEQKLICSTIVSAQISRIRTDQPAIEKFNMFLKRRSVQYVDFENRASNLTADIIDYYNIGNKIPGKKMDFSDAQHLAVSILYKVDAFYTFDRGKRGGMDLLSLGGNVAGHNLTICKPPLPAHLRMDLQLPAKSETYDP